jgi:hypothetical protein
MLTFQEGQLIGRNNVLKVTKPIIVLGDRNRRHYETTCTVCNLKRISRYDVYRPDKSCPHNCHSNFDLIGKKFATYEVLKHKGPSISGVEFKCRCICGKEFNKIAKLIRRTMLTGKGHGCGCKQSRYITTTRVKEWGKNSKLAF